MIKKFVFILIIVTVLALGGGIFQPLSGDTTESKWSNTTPSINKTHVFHGELNSKGKPVGFHSRPGGKDPVDAGVIRIIDNPNRAGVYTAAVWIRKTNKTKFSSFFPDKMSREEVLEAILHAYKNTIKKGSQFRGPSGPGPNAFTIEGYLSNGNINTAYPIYRR